MKFAFYFFMIVQILNSLVVFAEKVKEDSLDNYKPIENIIWNSYKGEEIFFEDEDEDEDEELFQSAEGKAAWKESSVWRNRTLRFSFEEIDMPDQGENMGLYGLGAYDRLNPWLYGGITLYGAASGRRGGFFTGGYTLGVEHNS